MTVKVCMEIKPGMCLKDRQGDLSIVTSVTEDRVNVVIVGNTSGEGEKTPWVYDYSEWGIEGHQVEIISPDELETLLED